MKISSTIIDSILDTKNNEIENKIYDLLVTKTEIRLMIENDTKLVLNKV